MSVALRTYYRGAGLVAMRDHVNGVTRNYKYDHQGTVQCLTDNAGAVTDRFAGDAWGVEVKREGASINRQWYVGNLGYYRQVDQALDYVRARYVAPGSAVWLTKDPLGEMKSYPYSDASPARLIDPSGMVPRCMVESTTIMENYPLCRTYPAGLGRNRVLSTRVLRICATIRCIKDIHCDTDLDKCPESPSWKFCQGVRGTLTYSVDSSNPKRVMNLTRWCPDNHPNKYRMERDNPPWLDDGTCTLKDGWIYGGTQHGPWLPEGSRPQVDGRTLYCRYKMCMFDAPGAVEIVGSRDCSHKIDVSRWKPSIIPQDRLPMHVFWGFRSWVCSNTMTGELAPGADYVYWRHRARFVGDRKRQQCDDLGLTPAQDGC